MLLALIPLLLLQTSQEPRVVIKLDKSTVTVGSVAKGKATITFAEGLHSYQNPPALDYQIPLKLKVNDSGFVLFKVAYPKGTELTMPGDDKPSKVYEGTVEIPFQVKASKKAAKYRIGFQVDYQLCNATSCFPPSSLTVKVPLSVVASGKKAK